MIVITKHIRNNMPIKVLLDTICTHDMQRILDYYNTYAQNKSVDTQPLELLDRYEGGFQISIPEMKDVNCDENKKIKQLRWHKGFLVSGYYIGFDNDEEELLYTSLVHVLGQDNVIR
jgi:hypothetical protein